MKKIIASASLAALGAASLQAAYAPGLSPQEQSKPWTLSATLRGFYDDNSTTSASSAKEDSFGVEISPSLAVNLALDQTLIGFNYTYNMRFYEGRDTNSADHSHLFNLKLNHAFNERYKLSVSDSFVRAQEQQVVDDSVITTLRNNANYIRNAARIGFDAELTHNIGLRVSYSNGFYDYDEDGFADSRSAVLDRVEHVGGIDLRWQALPATVGVFGYQYEMVNYTSSDSLTINVYTDPETRNRRTHRVFVGVDQNFTSQLQGSVRLGGQFTDYPEALPGQDDSSEGPYADANLTWTYNPGSYLQLGVKHTRNSTDLAFPAAGAPAPVLDQESTAVYGVVNHRIAPKLTGSLLGHFQRSTFNGGFADGEVDQMFLLGVNLSHQINAFLSAEAGYNYDRLDSDIAFRSFTRNRVYIGLRASY